MQITKRSREKHTPRRPGGLGVVEENRIRQNLRRQVPSEPWLDAQFVNVCDRDERGQVVMRRRHDPSVFPPGGPQTGMCRCPACGIFTPPMAFEDGVCLDHGEHANWGPSPSARAIEALQWRNLRLPEEELPPESATALREEIRRHEMRTAGNTKRNTTCRPAGG